MIGHVALLRGINVGGKNIIRMDALAAAFTALKLGNVRTYIASGNVLFTAPAQDLRALEKKIERRLEKDFDYEATVVVKSAPEMAVIERAMPRSWARPRATHRHDVLFLRHEVDARDVLEQLVARPGVETLDYAPGVLYWTAKRSEIGKSTVARLPGTKLYRSVTIRNLNTTRKLIELVRG